MGENAMERDASAGPGFLPRGERLARILLFINPAFFAGNMLMARATADLVPPVALAFWRWAVAFSILSLFVGPALWKARADVLAEWRDLLPLGALGMGVCGAFVYIGADTTTATNIGLIYAGAPVVIILLDHVLYGAQMIKRQWLGVALALAGMLLIVFRGSLDTLLRLSLTPGDLWIVAAATSWAIYSIVLKHRPSKLQPNVRFAAIMLYGVAVLLPFHLWESLFVEAPSLDARSLGAVAFLALVPSIGAYGTYGYMQRFLGASTTSLILYLIPVYAVSLGFLLLGERLALYHFAGAAMVLPGIWLATRKRR
jgi:drug/metabolite transporter (DMT)-like permease